VASVPETVEFCHTAVRALKGNWEDVVEVPIKISTLRSAFRCALEVTTDAFQISDSWIPLQQHVLKELQLEMLPYPVMVYG